MEPRIGDIYYNVGHNYYKRGSLVVATFFNPDFPHSPCVEPISNNLCKYGHGQILTDKGAFIDISTLRKPGQFMFLINILDYTDEELEEFRNFLDIYNINLQWPL